MSYGLAQENGASVTYGWFLNSVTSGGPSDGTLKTDDIIIALNQTLIRNGDDLASYLEEKTLPGQNLILTVVRGNSTLDLTVTLEERPAPPV